MSITKRIEQIVDEYGLTPSRLADEIGVQRSSISHILSERNKPSLDLVMKILKKYPEINADWLVSGNGKMQLDMFGFVPPVEKKTDTTEKEIKTIFDKSKTTFVNEPKSETVILPEAPKQELPTQNTISLPLEQSIFKSNPDDVNLEKILEKQNLEMMDLMAKKMESLIESKLTSSQKEITNVISEVEAPTLPKIEEPKIDVEKILEKQNSSILEMLGSKIESVIESKLNKLQTDGAKISENETIKKIDKENIESEEKTTENPKKNEAVIVNVYNTKPLEKKNTQFSEPSLKTEKTAKKLTRIVMFYNDNTFEVFEQ